MHGPAAHRPDAPCEGATGTELARLELLRQLGQWVRDKPTGIAGQVISVCFNHQQNTQFLLRRHGVDGQGAPFATLWVYAGDTFPISFEEAKY